MADITPAIPEELAHLFRGVQEMYLPDALDFLISEHSAFIDNPEDILMLSGYNTRTKRNETPMTIGTKLRIMRSRLSTRPSWKCYRVRDLMLWHEAFQPGKVIA